jgi:hypothetical protein
LLIANAVVSLSLVNYDLPDVDTTCGPCLSPCGGNVIKPASYSQLPVNFCKSRLSCLLSADADFADLPRGSRLCRYPCNADASSFVMNAEYHCLLTPIASRSLFRLLFSVKYCKTNNTSFHFPKQAALASYPLQMTRHFPHL